MNNRFKHFIASVALIVTAMYSSSAMAQTTVSDAWARATVAGQGMGGAFMTLTSDRTAQLIGASSPAAQEVQIHTMQMDGERMRMQQIGALELPAGVAVPLMGHYHLMLMGLKAPLTQGQMVSITLKIKQSSGYVERVTVNVPVRSIANP